MRTNITSCCSTSIKYRCRYSVPLGILKLVIFASLLSLGGMGYYFGLSGGRHVVLTFILSLVWCASFLLTVNLDRPRTGNITISADPLVWTLEGMR